MQSKHSCARLVVACMISHLGSYSLFLRFITLLTNADFLVIKPAI